MQTWESSGFDGFQLVFTYPLPVIMSFYDINSVVGVVHMKRGQEGKTGIGPWFLRPKSSRAYDFGVTFTVFAAYYRQLGMADSGAKWRHKPFPPRCSNPIQMMRVTESRRTLRTY